MLLRSAPSMKKIVPAFSVSALILAVLLGSCANPYKQFYTSWADAPEYRASLSPFSGKTEIFSSDNFKGDNDSIYRRGYVALGIASFEGGGRSATEAQLREKAKEVGADIILVRVDFKESQQTAVPWTTYNPGASSTSTTSGVVNATVSNNRGGSAYGSAVYSGQSTTQSSGTYSTQMIPVTVNRYEWEAMFWRKAKPSMFGAKCDNLTDELKKMHQRNSGLQVEFVRDDSPAFHANILPGDIIIAVGDVESLTTRNFADSISRHAGQQTAVKIIRGSETKVVMVKLNEKSN